MTRPWPWSVNLSAYLPRPKARPTTPCCECDGTLGTPWSYDKRMPQCDKCAHVCAHEGRPYRWA
jgi:hypothetical protein